MCINDYTCPSKLGKGDGDLVFHCQPIDERTSHPVLVYPPPPAAYKINCLVLSPLRGCLMYANENLYNNKQA